MLPIKWLRARQTPNLGMLTGQDINALNAIGLTWDLYATSDADGRAAALAAVRALLGAMQPKCRPLTRDLIARALDWSERDQLWRAVTEP